jgi:hypothetical protein
MIFFQNSSPLHIIKVRHTNNAIHKNQPPASHAARSKITSGNAWKAVWFVQERTFQRFCLWSNWAAAARPSTICVVFCLEVDVLAYVIHNYFNQCPTSLQVMVCPNTSSMFLRCLEAQSQIVLLFRFIINRWQHYVLLWSFFDQWMHFIFIDIHQRSKNEVTMQQTLDVI